MKIGDVEAILKDGEVGFGCAPELARLIAAGLDASFQCDRYPLSWLPDLLQRAGVLTEEQTTELAMCDFSRAIPESTALTAEMFELPAAASAAIVSNNLSFLLEEAQRARQFPTGLERRSPIVPLPAKHELKLAAAGQLSIGRATELGMYEESGESITVSEWKKGLSYRLGKPVSVSFGSLVRTAMLEVGNTIFVAPKEKEIE